MKFSMAIVSLAVAALIGCGSDGNGNRGTTPAGGGTVMSPWDEHCIATFTTDYSVLDVFDDPSSPPGPERLISSRITENASVS